MRCSSLSIQSTRSVLSRPDDPDVVELSGRLGRVLEESEAGSVVPVSLDGKVFSGSCLAVVLGPALKRVVSGACPGRYVVVDDPGGRNSWDGDAALRKVSADEKTKLVCVWNVGGARPRLVGDVDRAVQETYDFVFDAEQSGGPCTTRDLAEASKMRIQAASNRVSTAAALGVVRTVETKPADGGGVQRLLVAVR